MTNVYNSDWDFEGREMFALKVKNYLKEALDDREAIKMMIIGSPDCKELSLLDKKYRKKIDLVVFDFEPRTSDEKVNKLLSTFNDYKFIKGDFFKHVERKPFGNTGIDIVFHRWFLHHCTTKQKEESFRLIKSFIRDEGLLIIIDWFSPDWTIGNLDSRLAANQRYYDYQEEQGLITPKNKRNKRTANAESEDGLGGKFSSISQIEDILCSTGYKYERQLLCRDHVDDPELFGQNLYICKKKKEIRTPQVIAEIGWNHMGDMSLAEKMIKSAASSGAHYAKFQTWSVERLKEGEWDADGRRQIYEKAELDVEKHKLLIALCKKHNIEFLSSVFSIEDAKLLASLGVKEVKVPSFECRNHDLLKFCNDNFKKVFLSTGTSLWEEIKESAKLFDKANLVLMHCVSTYPCEPNMANITKIEELKKICNHVGYSDHIFGVESAKVAMKYNIDVIEKHFTTDRDLPGRDNKFAILPEELKDLTNYINMFYNMHKPHGLDYQACEKSSRLQYAGRFNK